MKKAGFTLLLLSFLLIGLSAGDIDLGNFPVGKWVDSRYEAVWTFSTGNIQLFTTGGDLVFDFDGKVDNFKVNGSLSGVEITFSCKETGRTYKFVKGVSNLDLQMVIDKDSGVHYDTPLKIQK